MQYQILTDKWIKGQFKKIESQVKALEGFLTMSYVQDDPQKNPYYYTVEITVQPWFSIISWERAQKIIKEIEKDINGDTLQTYFLRPHIIVNKQI